MNISTVLKSVATAPTVPTPQ